MSKTLVVIPHYNKIELLTECINHLQKDESGDYDVLIVDNGSLDGSVNYINDLCNNNKNYHSILLSENVGFAKAVNKGLEFSISKNYRYSILLNNDAFVKKHFVKNLQKAMDEKNFLFAISSLMLSKKDENVIDDYGDSYNILGYAVQNKNGLEISDIKKNYRVFSACGGASIYDNYKLKITGLFDEKFFAYLEDIDLSFRAKLFGYDCSNCKEAQCIHIGSATSGSKYNSFKVKLSARNNIYLIYKNMPIVLILLNFIPLFIGSLLKFIYFVLRGFGKDYICGIIEGFKTLKNVERFNFRKSDLFTILKIELEMIINLFLYIRDFTKRKFNVKRK